MTAPQVVLTEDQIKNRVREMAKAISTQADSSNPAADPPLCVTAVLDNGFMFMCDLVRCLTIPVACQFLKLETRDMMHDGHERREILHTVLGEIKGRDFLLVDAVLHTGLTLDYLVQQLLRNGARSVKTAVLIDKPEERRVDLTPDFWGFRVSGRFLVGYGLGRGDLYRNLPYVGNLAA